MTPPGGPSRWDDRFNAVVLLTAPAHVILNRVARRPTNNYGKTPLRAMILDDIAREGCSAELDASRPLADIVLDLTTIRVAPEDDLLGEPRFEVHS